MPRSPGSSPGGGVQNGSWTSARNTCPLAPLDQPEKHLLGTWRATAICGNDITSIFQGYFLAAGSIVAIMFLRRQILKLALYVSKAIFDKLGRASSKVNALTLRCLASPMLGLSNELHQLRLGERGRRRLPCLR